MDRRARRTLLAVGVAIAWAAAVGAPVAAAPGAPSLAFAPAALTFGPVDPGTTTAAQQLTLVNNGSGRASALTVTLTGVGAARFTKVGDTCTGSGLAPARSCAVSFTYTPSAYGASDSATVTVTPRKLQGSATAALAGTSSVRSNAAPVVNDQVFQTNEDVPLLDTFVASDPDGDALAFTVASGPAHGRIVLGTTPGAFTYTPAADYAGSDSFTVTVTDTSGAADSARMLVNVSPVNDAPVAVDDSVTAGFGKPVAIAVLANDYDLEGDALGIASFTQPAHGVVTRNPQIPSQLIYTPVDCVATDEFSYQASDASGNLSNTATVTITSTCQ